MLKNVNYGASLGKVNLKTGKCKYFNIYDTWGEDTTYEIYQLNKPSGPQYRVFATSGTTPYRNIGDRVLEVSLGARNRQFNGVMVDFAVGTQLKELAAKYGNSLTGYTYK